MDFFDQIMAYSFLKSGSLELLLNNMPQHTTAPRGKSGRQIMAEALTGKIRSNAAMLRQGANNASEAASMSGSIANAAASLSATLSEMLALAQKVQADPSQSATASPAFKALATTLAATVSGAQYNGISLLDSDAWGTDKRLTVSADGAMATVPIQLGYGTSTFSLYSLSGLKGLTSVDLSTISPADLTALTNSLTGYGNIADSLNANYTSLATSYTSEKNFMIEQAEILARAAKNALPDETDPLLRNRGGIVSSLG
ncbi:hypothetical protein [Desulfovibrio sp. 86]|uniref:Putative Flagellin domain protein n=1 Tax=uncultured Desulfovibrio sp. TaxID=167968 RepID=A0A212L8F4_9BACT|nr:hypothetical protein [Desulfovibrio sp. 86]SCM73852.1 putative Flagellin domain protein [uncultured Desulfovibrio sp.]VZH34469.1 putative Flagellin domain protein [Desulfovibrio sp. 86]